jgi:YD repeat-containing protein
VEQVVDPGHLDLHTVTRWDGLGNRKEVVDPRGKSTAYDYDGLGRLLRVRDAKQKETVVGYDGEGLKISETDRRGVQKTFLNDNLRRLRRTELVPRADMSGVAWSAETQYLDHDRKRIEIDARGARTVLDLDGLDRVMRLTDPDGKVATTIWDGLNRRGQSDKRNHMTVFDYDKTNRLVLTRDPEPFDGQTLETTYDDAHNQRHDPDGPAGPRADGHARRNHAGDEHLRRAGQPAQHARRGRQGDAVRLRPCEPDVFPDRRMGDSGRGPDHVRV